MRDYQLGFIDNRTIFDHVRQTVELYRTHINLREFNKNIIDPIKLTFNAKVYGKTLDEIIESESIRQMIDKTNTNHIGYFHQNLFRYAENGWEVPETGFDVVNEERHIFAYMVDFKNVPLYKLSRLQLQMNNKLLHDNESRCYIIDINNAGTFDDEWVMSNDDCALAHPRLRIASIKSFYDIVFGENSYDKLCKALPCILEDIA